MQRQWILSLPTLVAAGLLLSGCAATGPYSLTLMDTPLVFEARNPADANENGEPRNRIAEVLFATDRRPERSEAGDLEFGYRRGYVVHLGLASVTPDRPSLTWQDLTDPDRLRREREGVPIRIERLDNFGILRSSVTDLSRFNFAEELKSGGEDAFLQRLEQVIDGSKSRRIRIYVHGFRTPFDNPLLVTAELAHFMDQDGAFIAYSWPSKLSQFGYFGDTESAQASAFLFRNFLEFLLERADPERIDIIAFSAGTRLVASALHQIVLRDRGAGQPSSAETRFGQVLLVGSDIDRQVFAGFLSDGLLDAVEQLSIYVSASDRALDLSRLAWGQERLGQDLANTNLKPALIEQLRANSKLHFIDVSAADGTRQALGHGYLRRSPWVSSDILMTLLHGLQPGSRGLVRAPGLPLWTFPENYVERARLALELQRADSGATNSLSGSRADAGLL
ncbi:MAG: alpha/beta hydrolase [Wenzhouxiangellaceae bacterium]|nr:alpha/beta hydrolase [Wenzhouxiangellaceae bacterium]